MGNTAQASAVVLASYFTGLATGQIVGSILVVRVSPLFGYGVAEIVAAGSACLVPTVLSWASTAGSENSGVGQGVWCFVALLPSTVALGTTFPFMAEYLFRVHARGQRFVSRFYALNTVGGLVGIVSAAAVLLASLGVVGSGYLAAGISAACGLFACVLAVRRTVSGVQRVRMFPAGERTSTAAWEWWVAAAVSGFVTLGLEVLYVRAFALVFHNSTYTFGAVVAVFLAGLALGAALVATAFRRVSPQIITGVACAVGGVLLPTSTALFARLTELRYFAVGESFAGYLSGAFGLAALIILPPATALGAVVPAALAATDREGGRSVGRLVSVNTFFAVAGALAAGFFLPSWFGLWGAFWILTVLVGAVGVFFLARDWGRRRAGGVAATACGLALLAAAWLMADASEEGEEVVRQWESAYGRIDVVRSRTDGSLRVRQNLHYRHGSTANAVREYRQGRLPLLLHARPTDVAFLGVGTGLTAAPLVRDNRVERGVLVELVPEVIESARLLGDANLGVIDHPKVEVVIDDARHYAARSQRQFDVVISDLFVPWESRTGYLYTVEFYEVVRKRLNPGGLFCQWLALYQLGPGEFELIADSFATAFPEVTLWWGQFDARFPMVALVGSEVPLVLSDDELQTRFAAGGEMPGGVDPDLGRPEDLPVLFLGRWPKRQSPVLNTDEHPLLEFRAPLRQRSKNTLSGPIFRTYFDSVLQRLPDSGVEWSGSLRPIGADTLRRRAAQHISLFGGAEP